MRVIAGKAKGKLLYAPSGMNTRPITAKMKEALFNIWQNEVIDADFLDLFAGSGSMGIEALSRGAKKAVFVELDKHAIDVIKENIKNCKFNDCAVVYKDDVFNRISLLKATNQTFDIIYLDPPFTRDEIFHPVLEAVTEADILNQDGEIAIRTVKEKEMPEEIGDYYRYKLKIYGQSAIHFYCKYAEE